MWVASKVVVKSRFASHLNRFRSCDRAIVRSRADRGELGDSDLDEYLREVTAPRTG